MQRKTIPGAEWTISVSLYPERVKGEFNNAPLAQRAIGVVDSQRHNVGHLVQGLVDETFDMLPNKGKRVARYGEKKGHA